MRASQLKSEALAWLRYVKRCTVIATECGNFHADVLGVGDGFTVEVETKISVSDLRADFKKTKHILYQGGVPGTWVPNFFYVLVPVDIQEKALAVLEEKGPKYGLLVFEENKYALDGRKCKVVKRPQKLHAGLPRDRLRDHLSLRVSSELVGLHLLLDKWSLNLSTLLSDGHRDILASIDKVLVAPVEPDPEES